MVSRETRTRLARREGRHAAARWLISHSSLGGEVFASGAAPRHVPQESTDGRMSAGRGNILASGFRRGPRIAPRRSRTPSSRLHRPFGRLDLERSYPVTAAQLPPIYTEFLPATHKELAANTPRADSAQGGICPDLCASASAATDERNHDALNHEIRHGVDVRILRVLCFEEWATAGGDVTLEGRLAVDECGDDVTILRRALL